MNKLTPVIRSKETDLIQKCIGQITTSQDGGDDYSYGTGTTYKHLGGKYYLVITCAHNLVYFDDVKNDKQKAKKLFYLPNGIQEQKTRLICVDWIAHERYNPRLDHCSNDIGIILCFDPTKYYSKNNIHVNDFVSVNNWTGEEFKRCSIFGYPVDCQGKLMGKIGTANKDKKYNEWRYNNINTYKGQSGSALYKFQELDDGNELFTIYGIHTFGNITQNVSRGVYFDVNHMRWITMQETEMKAKMHKHEEARKRNKEMDQNEVTLFLHSIGLTKYCKNFADKGYYRMDHLENIEHDFLYDTLLIKDYKDMQKIIEETLILEREREKEALGRMKMEQQNKQTVAEQFGINYMKEMKNDENHEPHVESEI